MVSRWLGAGRRAGAAGRGRRSWALGFCGRRLAFFRFGRLFFSPRFCVFCVVLGLAFFWLLWYTVVVVGLRWCPGGWLWGLVFPALPGLGVLSWFPSLCPCWSRWFSPCCPCCSSPLCPLSLAAWSCSPALACAALACAASAWPLSLSAPRARVAWPSPFLPRPPCRLSWFGWLRLRRSWPRRPPSALWLSRGLALSRLRAARLARWSNPRFSGVPFGGCCCGRFRSVPFPVLVGFSLWVVGRRWFAARVLVLVGPGARVCVLLPAPRRPVRCPLVRPSRALCPCPSVSCWLLGRLRAVRWCPRLRLLGLGFAWSPLLPCPPCPPRGPWCPVCWGVGWSLLRRRPGRPWSWLSVRVAAVRCGFCPGWFSLARGSLGGCCGRFGWVFRVSFSPSVVCAAGLARCVLRRGLWPWRGCGLCGGPRPVCPFWCPRLFPVCVFRLVSCVPSCPWPCPVCRAVRCPRPRRGRVRPWSWVRGVRGWALPCWRVSGPRLARPWPWSGARLACPCCPRGRGSLGCPCRLVPWWAWPGRSCLCLRPACPAWALAWAGVAALWPAPPALRPLSSPPLVLGQRKGRCGPRPPLCGLLVAWSLGRLVAPEGRAHDSNYPLVPAQIISRQNPDWIRPQSTATNHQLQNIKPLPLMSPGLYGPHRKGKTRCTRS